jgi:hypothetical protein
MFVIVYEICLGHLYTICNLCYHLVVCVQALDCNAVNNLCVHSSVRSLYVQAGLVLHQGYVPEKVSQIEIAQIRHQIHI